MTPLRRYGNVPITANMGTLRLWEAAPCNLLFIKGLGDEQVPITLSGRDVSKHGEQFVTHAVKGPLAVARWPSRYSVETATSLVRLFRF